MTRGRSTASLRAGLTVLAAIRVAAKHLVDEALRADVLDLGQKYLLGDLGVKALSDCVVHEGDQAGRNDDTAKLVSRL